MRGVTTQADRQWMRELKARVKEHERRQQECYTANKTRIDAVIELYKMKKNKLEQTNHPARTRTLIRLAIAKSAALDILIGDRNRVTKLALEYLEQFQDLDALAND
jgi:hypothetical protein